MLSTCSEPLATASPCMAYFSSSSLLQGCGSSALAATTAPTAEAAEPPRPEPSGMPLSMRISKPKPGCSASCMARARPAVVCAGSVGKFPATPTPSVIVTPLASVRLTVTRSPRADTEKQMATLPTDAGANAVAQRGVTLKGALRSHTHCIDPAGRRHAPRCSSIACRGYSRDGYQVAFMVTPQYLGAAASSTRACRWSPPYSVLSPLVRKVSHWMPCGSAIQLFSL